MQGKARSEYCRICKRFNEAWAEISPSKPVDVRLPSAIDKAFAKTVDKCGDKAYYTKEQNPIC